MLESKREGEILPVNDETETVNSSETEQSKIDLLTIKMTETVSDYFDPVTIEDLCMEARGQGARSGIKEVERKLRQAGQMR